MKKSIFAALLIGTWLVACSPTPTTTAPDIPAESFFQEVQLELNEGKKWVITPEMSPAIKASFEVINQASTTKGNDFKQLHSKLDTHKNTFIASCNMEGKSHKVLHVWLLPYLDLLENIAEEKATAEEKEMLMADLMLAQQLFEVYFEY